MRNIFYRILERRHFWRYATFSEVAELYISRMLRMVGIYISASFISVFLYQNGYSVRFIVAYWGIYYAAKVITALPLAKYAAKFGPKHGILLSNLLYIPSMVILPLVSHYGLPILVVAGGLQALSATLYNMCYYIDFSKVKAPEHAGKEIAYMNIFEKVATGLSPLIGGGIALIAGPSATMWAAAIFFALAALPLLRTSEPIETKQKLVFRGFPWRLALRSLVANTGVGFDVVASGTVWVLLIAIVIVGVTHGNGVYAIIGGLASLIILADVVFSYVYGVLIDRKRGGALLKFGLLADIVTHLSRPFAQTVFSAGTLNVANEAATTGYMMAFTRGMFDVADRTGHRTTYIGFVEMMQDMGASFAAFLTLIMVSIFGEVHGLRGFFFAAGAFMLIIFVARFPLYRR